MAVILKPKEKVILDLGELKFHLTPLTWRQKAQVTALATQKGGEIDSNLPAMTALTIKYGLKAVEGLEREDGTKYELSFDPNGLLKDECIDDLLDLEGSGDKLLLASIQLFSKTLTADSIPGVKVVFEKMDIKKN